MYTKSIIHSGHQLSHQLSKEGSTTLIFDYFSLFWWIYATLPMVGILLIIYYLSNADIDLMYLFKVPLVGTFLILIAFHIKSRLQFSPITLLFGCFGIVALFNGAIEGTLLTKASLTHIYMIAIAIMGCSFGYNMAAKYDLHMKRLIQQVMDFIFIISIITLSLYFYFHYITNSIAYFGFDSYLPLVTAIFLADKKYIHLASAFILVVFSGKRAPLLSMLTPLLIMQVNVLIKPRPSKMLINLFIVAFLISCAALIITKTDLADRWKAIASTDTSSLDSIYMATSGRSVELIGLWDTLSNNQMRLLIGTGIGGQFTINSEFRGELINREQHYLHLAVMTYLLVFGAPFLLFLLGYITYIFWRNRQNFTSFFYLGMMITFVGSFFGAGIIVEPIFWVFLGANQYSIDAVAHDSMQKV